MTEKWLYSEDIGGIGALSGVTGLSSRISVVRIEAGRAESAC